MDVLCEKDDCEKEATTRYVWPWGDEGFLCDDHRGHTQQLADQLGRVVSFTPLGPPREPSPPAPGVKDLVEQLQHAAAENQELRSTLEASQRALVEAQQQVSELSKANRRNVRATQVDSDVETPTASTDPTESHRETQSQPKGPRPSR